MQIIADDNIVFIIGMRVSGFCGAIVQIFYIPVCK